MKIGILGSGCKKCTLLAQNAEAAATAAGLSVEIEKITDIVEIARHGVMTTPGLAIDNRVVSSGKVLSVEEISRILASL